MLKFKLLAMVPFMLLFAGAFGAENTDDSPALKNILILTSYHMTHDWTERLVVGIETYSKNLPYRLVFQVAEMDALRTVDPEARKVEFLRELPKLQSGKYDLLVVLDDPALDLVLEYADALAPQLPVVFAGIENYTPRDRERYPNLTGVTQEFNIRDTIKAGLALYPDTREVVVLSDSSEASRKCEAELKADMAGFDAVSLRFLNTRDRTVGELLDTVRKLPETTLIVLTPWRDLFHDDYRSLASFGVDLARAVPRPYLDQIDTMIGFGSMGGYLTLTSDQAEAATDLIGQVFARGGATEIPPVKGKTRPVFDYNVLAANHLNMDVLPKDTVLLNRPLSFWEVYHNEFLVLGSVGGSLLLSLIGYIVYRQMIFRRNMRLFQSLPGRVGVCNRKERILFLHDTALESEALKAVWLRDIVDMDYGKVSVAMARVFVEARPVCCEYEYREVKRSMTIAPLPRGVFGTDSVVWFAHDNSEAQEYRTRLEDLLAEYQVVLNKMPGYVTTKDIDRHFQYVSCNDTGAGFWARTREQILGRTDFEIFADPRDARRSREDDEAVLNAPGQESECMRTFIGMDGKLRQGVFFRKVLELSGRRRLLLTVTTDVTELHEAKVLAEEMAERFELTLRSIGDGVLATDSRGVITMLNQVAERLLGRTQEQVAGLDHTEVFRIVSYLDDSPVPSPVTHVLQTGEAVELANHTDLLSWNGTRYHIADSASPIRNREGIIIGVILVFRDVTAEYDKRDRLRNALLALDYGSELSAMAAFHYDLKDNRISGSKLLSELWPNQDGKPAHWKSWIFEEDWSKFEQVYHSLVSGVCDNAGIDFRSNRAGEMRYYRMKASLDSSNPQAPRLLGVIQDVTEITRNAWKLNDTLELWKMISNSIPVSIFAKNVANDFRYVLANRTFSEFVGAADDEIVGKNDFELFSQRDSAPGFRAKDEEIIRNGMAEEFAEYPVDARGSRRSLRTTKMPFTGTAGQKLLLGMSIDVTELNSRIESEQITNAALAQLVLENDFSENLKNIFQILAEQMQCDRISWSLYDKKHKQHRIRLGWERDGIASATELPQELVDQAFALVDLELRRNRLVMWDQEKIGKHSDVFGQLGIRSGIAAPIFVANELWATIVVAFHREGRYFTVIEEKLMRSMANIIALAQIRERQRLALYRADHEKQMILNNIRIPIWLHDKNGELLQANTAGAHMAGIPAAELNTDINRRALCDGHPDWLPWPVEEVIQTRQPVQREVHYKNADYLVKAEPVFDESGELLYIVKSAVDVTRLNAFIANEKMVNFCLETLFMEEDVQQAIAQVLEAVCGHMQATRCYILHFDMEKYTASGFAEYVNPGCSHIITGLTDMPFGTQEPWVRRFLRHESMVLQDLLREDALAEIGYWKELVRKHGMRSMYAVGIYLNGKLWGDIGVSYEDKESAFSELDLNFMKAVAHLVELMLERREAQEQIMDALRLAQAADKAKSFFIASVSHEIRTPLNAVIGFAELLRDTRIDEETQKDYLDSIAYSGNALLQLINDVLDLSKLEAGQMQIMPEPTDFEALGREVMKVFAHRAQQNKVELDIRMPAMPVFDLDKLRVRQILFNLVGNAVKFTSEGNVTLWAEFYPAKDGEEGGCLRFAISDTGPGIAEADRTRLMEPFVQLSGMRGTNAGNQGSGLGLSIAKRLAERMNGEMWLESEVGKGSTFGVTLFRVHCSGEGEVRSQSELPLGMGGNPEQFSVLLVDDVEMNLKVMSAMLRKFNVKDVVAVASGSAALAALSERSFDLILTDMWMPGMNGAELAQRIRDKDEWQNIPIVAVTADVEASDNFVLSAFSGVLHKPVSLEKMQKMLSAIFSGATELM